MEETPTELANRLWNTAIQHLEAAANEDSVEASNAYCAIGQLALAAAQFALNNQAFLVGMPDGVIDPASIDPASFGLPPGSPPLPAHLNIPGAPPIPTWGQSS